MIKMRNMKNSKKAFTIVEMMVYLCIFSMLMVGVTTLFRYMGNFQSSTRRLDILHSLRLSSFKLSEELSLSREFLFPTSDNFDEVAHQIIYFNNKYELIVAFIAKENPDDEMGKLVKINWTKHLKSGSKEKPTPELLTNGAIELNVTRSAQNYLEYELKIKEVKPKGQPSGKTFTLVNGARLRGKM